MAKFAYIENDKIVGIYDDLPENWTRVSNFYLLANDLDHLRTLGWYAITKQDPEYDPKIKMPGALKYIFTGDSVIETREVIDIPPPPPQKTPEEIAAEQQQVLENQWSYVRHRRDQLMSETDWRYTRYARQQRLGLDLTDDIAKLDAYMQALADITSQLDPFDIVWPSLE